MFKSIKSKIFLTSFVVIFSFFSITLISTALLIRKAHIDFMIEDLLNDLNLFLQHDLEIALAKNDTKALWRVVMGEVEEHCVVDVIDRSGKVLVRSDGNIPDNLIPVTGREFKISRRAYGYSVHSDSSSREMVYVAMPLIHDTKPIGFIRIASSLKFLEETLNRFIQLIVLLFAGAMVLSLILNYLLSRGIYMPILQMTEVAQEIARENLDKTIPASNRKDEIGTLVRVFNSMIEKLRLVKEDRETIFSHISHDLMTPITTIRGFMEVLSDGKVTDGREFKECLHIIEQESSYLEALIDKLRLLTRLDSLTMNYRFVPLYITEEITEVERSLQLKTRAKELTIHTHFEAGIPPVNGDRFALKSVFVNILENAVKYSFAGGSIDVAVIHDSRSVQVSIKDHGAGIAPENHEKIFQRFVRINTNDHKIKGLGLGLGIVKEILTAHNASIRVHSSVGAGAEFIISFPAIKPSIYKKFT